MSTEIFIVEKACSFEGEFQGWEQHAIFVGRANYKASDFDWAGSKGYRVKKHNCYRSGYYETVLISGKI